MKKQERCSTTITMAASGNPANLEVTFRPPSTQGFANILKHYYI